MHCNRNIPPKPQAGHAEVQQTAAYRITDTDDSIKLGVQEKQPGLWTPVRDIADDAAVGDTFDVHAARGDEPVHCGALVEHVQNIVFLAPCNSARMKRMQGGLSFHFR